MTEQYLNQVVDFKRPKLDEEYLRGFVLDYSDTLTLLNVLDSDFYLNGFSDGRLRKPGGWKPRAAD